MVVKEFLSSSIGGEPHSGPTCLFVIPPQDYITA